MPVITRSGKCYDLTTSVSGADRIRRRRAGMSAQERALARRENAAGTRAARSRMTEEERAVERRENATGTRAARSRMTEEEWAVERREHAAGTRVALSKMTDEQRAVQSRHNAVGMRERRVQTQTMVSRSVWEDLPLHQTPNPRPITLGRLKVCPFCR